MSWFARVVLLTLAVLLLPGTLAAQSLPPVRVSATAAAYLPAGDFALRGGGSGPDRLRMDEGLAVGVNIESVTPIRWLGVRAGVDYAARSAVLAERDVGQRSCGQNCAVVVSQSERVGGASLLGIAADLVLRPAPVRWRVQPYTFAGPSWRKRIYDSGQLPPGSAAQAAEAEATGWVPHFGLGVDWAVGSLALALEAEGYADLDWVRGSDGIPLRGGSHGDFLVSVGVHFTP